MIKKLPKFGELPPEEHPIGIYIGLLLGGLILGTGTIILSRELLTIFSEEGLKLSSLIIIQLLLMSFSAFASLACFFGMFRMIALQRMQVKKVDKEFKNFVLYARPLVEEVIRQRLVGEKLLEKLENMQKLMVMADDTQVMEGGRRGGGRRSGGGNPSSFSVLKWEEFLVFVAILSTMSVGLFVYLEQHPWELVPYSLILLAVGWWVVIARYFNVIFDMRSYYLPAVFILIIPSLSIILRAYMEPYKVLYVVFLFLGGYVILMYFQFRYLMTGTMPGFLTGIDGEPVTVRRIPSGLHEYMPPKKEHAPEDLVLEKLKDVTPQKER